LINEPTFYLCAAPDSPGRKIFTRPRWQGCWAQICDRFDEIVEQLSIPVLSLSSTAPLPVTNGDGTLRICELHQLDRLRRHGHGWSVVVFEPSRLACLDALQGDKHALVAARTLHAGETLMPGDLTVVVGGNGIDESFSERLIGRTLAYDVATGEPITFGEFNVE
jgi:hypothetical protein